MGKKQQKDASMVEADTTSKLPVWDLPDAPTGTLPPHLHLQRTRVLCDNDAPTHTENVQYSGAYASVGVDNSLRLDHFRSNFRVEFTKIVINQKNENEDSMEFDMIGIDASIANAFRRILIAEVPTMAIEKVLIANNTSVMQDEVLAHRLGLIPLNVDPRLFSICQTVPKHTENDVANEKNTIVFKLHIRCGKADQITVKSNGQKLLGGSDKKKDARKTVKSGEVKWLPGGSEFLLGTETTASSSASKPRTYTSFSSNQDSLPEFRDNPIGPKYLDINIARLGIGQEIELEAHAIKGMGKTHAKWSPVASAWYKMLPEVVLLENIEGEEAEKLKIKCPQKVFDIEDIGKNKKRAIVARPRNCTLCRECIRGDGWDKKVSIRRVKDHFLFSIESTGALPPEVLFTEAIKILEDKCERVITELS